MGVKSNEGSMIVKSKKTIMQKSKLVLFLGLFLGTLLCSQGQKDQPEVLSRPAQISLIYPIGTNGLESGSYINNISLNAIAGYSYGVNGFEAAGFANVTRSDVKGVQLAGFANVVGGGVTGTQAAGFVNVNRSASVATQLAGFANVSGGEGLVGSQLGGFANYSHGSLKGWQAAGFANYAGGPVTGGQVSPTINFANGEVKGVQISAVANYAKALSGVQIGLVNYVGEFKSGATIGLINIVRNGFSKFEVFHDDIIALNGAYKSGTKQLYGIVTAGIDPDKEYWIYGAGFGTQFDFKKGLFGNVETTFSEIKSTERRVNSYFMQRLNLNLGYNLFGAVDIVAGPSLNLFISKRTNGEPNPFQGLYPADPWYKKDHNRRTLLLWPGYRLAIRF